MKNPHFVTSCAVAALCSVSAGHAQEAITSQASATAQAVDERSDGGLEDIIVTAQRRSERLQSVPIAVTATTAARLEMAGIASTQALGMVTPGLVMAQTAGFTQPRIRGVGSTVNGSGFEPPVATYVDGVYVASTPAALMTLNNVSRVEVLKGPQGTLFGRNATGGLINVITKDPQQTPSLDMRLTYANYQTVTADAYVTGGLGEGVAIDLAARYEHQGEGWGTNLHTGNDVGKLDHDFAVRSKLLIEPGDDTQIRLAVDYQDRLTSRFVQKPSDRFVPIPFNNPFFGGPYPLGDGRHDINATTDPTGKLEAGGGMLQINHDFGGVSLQNIVAYRKANYKLILDVDYVPAFITGIDVEATSKQFSEEFQLSSNGECPIKWVAGVFYLHSVDANDPEIIETVFLPGGSIVPFNPAASTRGRLFLESKQVTTSIAGYAQASYEFLPGTTLTLGGRYTNEKKKLSGAEQFFGPGGFPLFTVPLPAPGVPDTLKFDRFNYRISLDHKFTPDVLAYVSYNTGFKSGGYNLNLPTDDPYKPEDIKAAEVGLKADIFGRRVRFNAAGYYYDYKNIQVGRYINGNSAIYNGAKAEVWGADFDAQVMLSRQFTLTAGFAYNDAKFKEFPESDYFVPIGGCVPTASAPCTGPADGNVLPFSPKVTFNAGADYVLPLEGGSQLAFNVIYFRSRRYYAASDNVSYQDAYDLVNASITWTDASQRLSLRAWAKNIGDTAYATTILESTAGNVFTYADPRTYGVTLGFKY